MSIWVYLFRKCFQSTRLKIFDKHVFLDVFVNKIKQVCLWLVFKVFKYALDYIIRYI